MIRFIKAWKCFRSVPISSFYLELRVAKYSLDESSIVYSVDVKRVLKLLLDGKLASMQDPMGISGYISACKSEVFQDEALSKLETALSRAEKAWEAEQRGDTSDAFDWWRLLYDYEFPTYYY